MVNWKVEVEELTHLHLQLLHPRPAPHLHPLLPGHLRQVGGVEVHLQR